MPQASQETIEEVQAFLPVVSDYEATKFLENAGYTLHPSWEWSKPGIHTLKDMTREEFACLLYLCHEWDYGGLKQS